MFRVFVSGIIVFFLTAALTVASEGAGKGDAKGNWEPAAEALMDAYDSTPPAAPLDFKAMAACNLREIISEAWSTTESEEPGQEVKEFALSGDEYIGAVGLVAAKEGGFPGTFTVEVSDGGAWQTVAAATSMKAVAGLHVWQFEPDLYHALRITATTVENRATGGYRINIPAVTVYGSLPGNTVRCTWTAPADDGNTASSGSAALYELWYYCDRSGVFTPVDDAPSPGPAGTAESFTLPAGSSCGTVSVYLWVFDSDGNMSPWVESTAMAVWPTGFKLEAPDDGASLTPGCVTPRFRYEMGKTAWPTSIAFSDGSDFAPTGTVKFRPTSRVRWIPDGKAWESMRQLASEGGALYYRLEGIVPEIGHVYGAVRSLYFEYGDITGLAVVPSHDLEGDEAVQPDKSVIPTFSWVNATTGMTRFLVDISTEQAISLGDMRRTLVLSKGVEGTSYTPTAAEWKKVRQLASWAETRQGTTGGCGELYWRVRAVAADCILSCTSATEKLVVDGGTFVTSDPTLDPGTGLPLFQWTHSGGGIARYWVEFSADGGFPQATSKTVRVPSRGVADDSYLLSAADASKLVKLAAKNGVSGLYWRIRSADADGAFVVYSDTHAAQFEP